MAMTVAVQQPCQVNNRTMSSNSSSRSSTVLARTSEVPAAVQTAGAATLRSWPALCRLTSYCTASYTAVPEGLHNMCE